MSPSAREALACRIEETVDSAARRGIHLALEYHSGTLADTPETTGWLLRRVPNLNISSFIMVVVLTLYFVSSLQSIRKSIADLVPLYRRESFVSLLEEITQSVGGVVAGGVTLSAINAAVVFVIQLAVGSSVPAVMAIAAFFVTLVPMIGSLVFLLIGGVATLFVSPTAALIFAICYLVYIQVEAYVVTPRIMGRAAAVPGVLVIIGAMIGATLLGLLGALVAIPLTASMLIVLRKVWIPRQNRQTEPPED